MSTQRLVFADEVTSHDFAQYAGECGWVFRDPGVDPDADIDEDLLESRWGAQGGDIRYADDLILGCQYVELESALDASVTDGIRQRFACYSPAEAVVAIDLSRGEEEVRRGFRLLAAVAVGEFDGAVFDVSVRGMRSSRSDIRESALIVPQRTNWVQFLPDVANLHEGDESGDVRQIAGGIRMALEIVQRMSGG